MSRILGFIARFVDEKLSAARVLISLLLLTLVTNGSLLLAQYGPLSGFDAPMPAFDNPSAPEDPGEPVPSGGALAEDRSSAPLPSPSGGGRTSTVTRVSGTLAAGDADGARTGDSIPTGSFTLPQSTELLRAVSSSGLPRVLSELVPISLWETVSEDLDGLLGRGASDIGDGEDPQANGGPQGGGRPTADEDPQGGGHPTADEGSRGPGGPRADEGSRGPGGPRANEDSQGGGDSPADASPNSDGGPKDGGGNHGGGGNPGGRDNPGGGGNHGGGGNPGGRDNPGGGGNHGGGGNPGGGGNH